MSGPKLLKKIPFLSALTAAHLRDVYRLGREVELQAGQSLFAKRQEADAMFVVLSGRVKICSDSASKKRKTFAYLQPKGPAEVEFPSTFTNEFLPKK